MGKGTTEVYVQIDLGDRIQNKGAQTYAFDLEPNNVSKTCEQDPTSKLWVLKEKTRRNYGSNLYMYGNELRDINTIGKDLSYDGVRFGETGGDGTLDVTLTVTADGSDGVVQGIIVYGDFSALQWATEAVLDDGTTITSDNEIWAIKWSAPAKTHTVTFKKWNRAGYNACFTHITELPSVLEFGKSRLRSITSVSQCTGQNDSIWYGVIWNTGSAQIYDADGEIYDYIRDGIIPDEQMPLRVIAKGKNGSTVIQNHLNGKTSYIKETRIMEIQLTNKLERWESLRYPGRPLTRSRSAWELLVEVFGTQGYTESEVEKMCEDSSSGEGTDTIKDFFEKSCRIDHPYLLESSFREVITKFCQLGMLWCYCDEDDNIKFTRARPNSTPEEQLNECYMPQGIKYGTQNTDIFLSNKITSVVSVVNKLSKDDSQGVQLSFSLYSPKEDEDGEPIAIDHPAAEDDFDNEANQNAGFVREVTDEDSNFTYKYAYIKTVFNLQQLQILFSDETVLGYSFSAYRSTKPVDGVGETTIISGEKKKKGDPIDRPFNWEVMTSFEGHDGFDAFEMKYFGEVGGTTLRVHINPVFVAFIVPEEDALAHENTLRTIPCAILVRMQYKGKRKGFNDAFYTRATVNINPYSLSSSQEEHTFQ